jgi:hypothetical protein
MDIATITAAYEGLKIGKTLLKSVYDSKVEADSKEKIDQVMSQLGDAQDTLFAMREELFRLQTENEEFRRKQSDEQKWDDKVSQYKLVKTAGGAVVYQFTGEPEHYACPSCIEKKSLQIIQDNRTMSGKYRCVACESEFPVNQKQKMPQQLIPDSGGWT